MNRILHFIMILLFIASSSPNRCVKIALFGICKLDTITFQSI